MTRVLLDLYKLLEEQEANVEAQLLLNERFRSRLDFFLDENGGVGMAHTIHRLYKQLQEQLKGGEAYREKETTQTSNNISNSNQIQNEEELELMKKIENLHWRESRQEYEWNKTIAGKRFTAYGKRVHEMPQKIIEAIHRKLDKLRIEKKPATIKQLQRMHALIKDAELVESKADGTSKQFVSVARTWFERYRRNDIKDVTAKRYYEVLGNQIDTLTKNIDEYANAKDELQDFIMNIAKKHPKTARFIFQFMRNVFKHAHEEGLIAKNPMGNLKSPRYVPEKREWLDLVDQQKVRENIDTCPIRNEVLFYLFTGARRSEAKGMELSREGDYVVIKTGKRKKGKPVKKRFVPISKKMKTLLVENQGSMFQNKGKNYYTETVSTWLASIKVHGHTLHDLRHTFATNLYYLGVDDKRRQVYLGHESIVMTQDVYTTHDPTIKKQHILDIWGDWFAEYS